MRLMGTVSVGCRRLRDRLSIEGMNLWFVVAGDECHIHWVPPLVLRPGRKRAARSASRARSAAAAGAALPIALPAVSALVLAAVLFVVPDLDVARKAVAAREEFARATSAYLDLTALERAAGAGATQSLEQAATVGDSWVFVRLREQLVRARLSGRPPWDGLHELSHELGLPELTDLADIMRLSGEEGAAVADTLRARSRGLRAALLTREQTRANEESERMVIPVALLGLIFLVILGAPAIVRIL